MKPPKKPQPAPNKKPAPGDKLAGLAMKKPKKGC